MYLQKISLSNFKSYEYESFEFSERVNCIVGENGTGKTNLLDAIYFLALTKSSISNQDALSINHEMEYMMVEGEFTAPQPPKGELKSDIESDKKAPPSGAGGGCFNNHFPPTWSKKGGAS